MMINQMLQIKYPIFQGAMANIATARFAADVSNSGALGILGTGAMNAAQVAESIDEIRTLTDKPFGVNVMLMNPDTDAIMQVIAEKKVPVVTTGAGNPGKYMEMLKASGTKVFPVVASVALAIRMERAGADGIIAEGTEAGGVFTHEDIEHFIELGADGVQMATRFIATRECDAHENFKQMIIQAKKEDIVYVKSPAGFPGRAVRNAFVQKTEKQANQRITNCLGCMIPCNPGDTPYCITRALIRAVQGDQENGLFFTGTSAEIINEMTDVHTLMESLKTGRKG